MSGTHEGWIDLSGKVALITGAASGIGRAAAQAIAAAGAMTIVADRDKAGVTATVEDLKTKGQRAIARVLDVTDESAWHNVGAWIQAEWGRLDILVNSAGIARFDRVDSDITPTYRQIFAVNVDGTLHGMTTALGFMRKAGRGAIVNVSSTASLKGNPGMASYGASKAAVSSLTRSAAAEVNRAGLDIRINAVLPGLVETGMAQQVYDQFDKRLGGRDKVMSLFSSGRAGSPDEIANLILFLLSDRASFMSGSAVVIDRAQSA